MTISIHMRRATLLDATIQIIERESFPPELCWEPSEITDEINAGNIWVYEIHGELVGYVAINLRGGKGHAGRINSVAVAHTVRGGGIGGILVHGALEILKEQGATCVELDCHVSLARWYDRFGFKVCGYYTTGLDGKTQRVVMRRNKK